MALDPPFVLPFKEMKNDGDSARLRRTIEQLEKRDLGLDERLEIVEAGVGAVDYGLYSARPAAGRAGRLYWATNSAVIYRDNGVSWDSHHPDTRHAITPSNPVLAGFTPYNFAGLTSATQAGDDVYLHDPATALLNMRVLYKTAPATPYTITASFYGNNPAGTSGLNFGWRNSSTLKMVTHLYQSEATGLVRYFGKWNSVSSFNGAYVFGVQPLGMPAFLRMSDTGVNLTTSVSYDGINFIALDSQARTDFITPDQVMIGWYSQNASIVAGFNWMSWNEAGGL